MEPVDPEPQAQVPPEPFNVRVERLNAKGGKAGRAYVRVKGHHTFGNLIRRTCAQHEWGDHNHYIWTSGTVTLYEYDNGRLVQMWEYDLPEQGWVMRIVGQPKMNNPF